MVAVGGFWFIPATHIASFWAFLLGVCVIAAGLTFLETIANPYTTVLGPIDIAATRINLAQSCNGIGLIFGPIAGGMFFYSKDAAGESTGSENLWIPYAAIGGRGHRPRRHLLFCQCSRHQRWRTIITWTMPTPGRLAFHLVAPAFRDGRRGAIPLRGARRPASSASSSTT